MNTKEKKISDNAFNLVFLGTSGSGRPTNFRNQSSTALKVHGKTFIFDVGENTQKQISYTKHIDVLDVNKIFITHLHVDHVNGLIPLILNVKLSLTSSFEMSKKKQTAFRRNSKEGENEVGDDVHFDVRNEKGRSYQDKDGTTKKNEFLEIEVYGPVGLFNFIAMNLALTHSNLYPVKVIVYELVNEFEEGNSNSTTNRTERSKIFHHNYKEFQHEYLERRKIYKNKRTDSWTIQQYQPNDEEDERNQHQQGSNESKQNPQYAPDRNRHKYVTIEAAEVQHVPLVQTFGYVLTEPTPQPKIDVRKATALGVRPSPKYRLFKMGQRVRNDDDTDWIYPDQVLCDDEDDNSNSDGNSKNGNKKKRKGRKVVYIGDTCNVSKSMINISRDCDVLIHEATLSKKTEEYALKRGHSTAKMAGNVAKRVNAKVLMLNHIGASNGDHDAMNELVQWAKYGLREGTQKDQSQSSCQVVATYDFMELVVPRNGFEFDKDDMILL